MSRPSLVKIWTDASHHDGIAGLAGWIRNGGGERILFMDVVLATSSGIAERLALERAMTIARRAHWRRVCFYTDAKKCWRGIPIKREDGWDIHWVPRDQNRQANLVSREVRKLWEAWNRGKGTIPNTPRPAAPEQNRMVAPPAGEATSIVSSPRVDRSLPYEGKTCTCGIGPWTDRKGGPGGYCSTCGGVDLGLAPIREYGPRPVTPRVRDRGSFIHVRVGGDL